jgi:YD repeat-containing protein
MQWDYKDQLRLTRRQRVNDEDIEGRDHDGERTFYVYDAAGQRVRKVCEKAQGLTEERIYLGGFEIFRKHGGPIGARHSHAGARDAACDGRQAADRAGGDAYAFRRHRIQVTRCY